MSVGLGTQWALSAALGLGLIFAGCGSSSPAEDDSSTMNGNPSIPVVGNYPANGGAGQASSSDGFKGWRSDAAGSSGTAAAGSSSAVATAGRPAAGSGGSAGSISTAGAGGAAGSAAAAGSGGAAEDDPLDIFDLGSGAPSCEGLICVEDKDCMELYPTETAACKLSKCVDFACK